MKDNVIINMAHLGARAFEDISGEVVQTTAFVFDNTNIKDYQSNFKRYQWTTTLKMQKKKNILKVKIHLHLQP